MIADYADCKHEIGKIHDGKRVYDFPKQYIVGISPKGTVRELHYALELAIPKPHLLER